ncbi:MAG: endonuclease/exonuclease/phosphatase family protein [Caldilineaceae bacterium]
MSPKFKQWVDTRGVVTGVTDTGFYLQDPVGDQNPATSDGIFVYTKTRPQVQPSACVHLQRAYVDEFYEKTELSRLKAITPATDCGATTLRPVTIPAPGLGISPTELFERYEGMLVQIENVVGVVQGPTEHFSNGNVEMALLPEQLAPYIVGGRVFQANPNDAAGLMFLSSAIGASLPDAAWGDQVSVGQRVDGKQIAAGVLDYNFGQYQLNLLPGQNITVEPHNGKPEQGVASTPDDFTVCTFNVLGLGRGTEQFPEEAAYQVQLHKRALAIVESLQGCTIVGVEETGAPEDAQNLAEELQASFHLPYTATAIAGPQTSDPAFPLTLSLLTRTDRVQVLKAEARQACSDQDYQVTVIPGACAEGEFALFDRPPLLAEVVITGTWGLPYHLHIVVNHWKSKAGDEQINAVRREKQARHVAALVQELVAADATAHVIVLGDLNDYYNSPPVEALRMGTQPPLVHAYEFLPTLARYTYIFNGAAQVLDHILLTSNMTPTLASVDPLHIDADFPAPATVNPAITQRASDHDPVQIRIRPEGVGMLGGNARYADIAVQVQGQTQNVITETLTDALGDFRVWNLTPATYTLQVTAPVYLHLAPRTFTLPVSAGYQTLPALSVQHRTVDVAAATALLAAQLAGQSH